MPILTEKNYPTSRFPNKAILALEGIWWITKVKAEQEKYLHLIFWTETSNVINCIIQTCLRDPMEKILSPN
jgi:hypothetical protein